MQTLEEQVYTIERALGERMVMHALIVVRSWLIELGENNPFEKAQNDLCERYNAIFSDWLVTDEDNSSDDKLDQITGDAYRLVDAVYAAIRIKRGLSPEMHGFNGENPQSIMHYFSSCVQFSEQDFIWMRDILEDSNRSSLALIAIAGLAKNLRECFAEEAMQVLVDGISASNPIVAEQCLANVLLLFIHYDVRIDFFNDLQLSFMKNIEGKEDVAFETLCAIIRSIKINWKDFLDSDEMNLENLPDELQNLLNTAGAKDGLMGLDNMLPSSEKEYMANLIQILPSTWVYMTVVGEDTEKLNKIKLLYLSIGSMDMMWDNIDYAGQFLVDRLRNNKGDAKDYINYGHCLLLKGDKMMAFENYRQARLMCKSAKEFYNLFRPDRRALVDHGVPVEQVYFFEDQLFSV